VRCPLWWALSRPVPSMSGRRFSVCWETRLLNMSSRMLRLAKLLLTKLDIFRIRLSSISLRHEIDYYLQCVNMAPQTVHQSTTIFAYITFECGLLVPRSAWVSHHPVLDVVHAEESLLVQGIYEMITKDDGILRWTRIWGWCWHGWYGLYIDPFEKN
jgi:hypothetical protein